MTPRRSTDWILSEPHLPFCCLLLVFPPLLPLFLSFWKPAVEYPSLGTSSHSCFAFLVYFGSAVHFHLNLRFYTHRLPCEAGIHQCSKLACTPPPTTHPPTHCTYTCTLLAPPTYNCALCFHAPFPFTCTLPWARKENRKDKTVLLSSTIPDEKQKSLLWGQK